LSLIVKTEDDQTGPVGFPSHTITIIIIMTQSVFMLWILLYSALHSFVLHYILHSTF